MSTLYLTEEQKKFESEFSEFLIQRINLSSGSLHIHDLSCLLQQARFEIRNAFGVTKSELIKFLKGHPKIFHVDSVGIITIATAVSDEDSDERQDNCEIADSEKSILKIEKGKGHITKLYPEYGFIDAFEPVETEVHFKSKAFYLNKDSLLTDSCLKIGDMVYFNAVYGHDDYKIKYQASKVWLDFENSNDSENSNENKSDITNDLQGKGVIQKISPKEGFILVYGKENETVFFSKNNVSDCNDVELTKFLKVGDLVEFSANRSDERYSKAQWQATDVRKKSKGNVQSSSRTKTKATDKSKIENVEGKIYPHSHGAIIKFGKNNSERADGDSSNYFLYGAEVSDISWEFSEGDDVWFDAIKVKSAPGWKAILVWVGEKPACVKNKVFNDETVNEYSDNSGASSSNISSVCSSRPKLTKLQKCSITEHAMPSKGKLLDQSVNRKASQPEFEYGTQNSKSFKSCPAKKMNKRRESKHRKIDLYQNKSKQHGSTVERKAMNRHNNKNSLINKNKDTKYQSNTELDDFSSHEEDNCLSSKSDISDQESDENEFSGRYVVNERDGTRFASSCIDEDNNNVGSTFNEIECHKIVHKKMSSIKKFENVEGEIVNLYCKAAIVQSTQLQKTVDFFLNVFYLNGRSVEEQEVIDLKEIIKVGDCINFNCFEIIDDSGEIHQKVTVAWKGPKPIIVYETTPEDFIEEHKLSVTMSDELVSEYSPNHTSASPKSHVYMLDSEENAITACSPAVLSSVSSSEGMSDAELFSPLELTETKLKDNSEENDSLFDLPEHHKLLSERINHRLEKKGLISGNLQVDFSGVLSEIISLARKHNNLTKTKSYNVNEELSENFKNVSGPICSTCSEKKSSVFCSKSKNVKHTAVQTIITGGIVAQNDDYSEIQIL